MYILQTSNIFELKKKIHCHSVYETKLKFESQIHSIIQLPFPNIPFENKTMTVRLPFIEHIRIK